MGQGWQETALWRELERRGDQASAIADAIKPLLRDLEPVLASGATGDLNFTLHDDEHAFRVAERIAELLGDEQLSEISSFDVGFSLAAAYGHDVGMTPARGKVQQHFAALLSARGMGELLNEDVDEFQTWLDDERDGLVPPLTDVQPTAADLRDARLIVAHYARHRHNDWSEEWLRGWAAKNNAGASLYPGWIADLVQICRSHHEGYERLSSRAFAPRRVGNPAQVLHLRHCAVLLRVADVLEIDPERTPDVVFERRAIDATSEIYWIKDHAISIARDGTGYTVTARPPDSAIHHAVVQTVAGIDAELQLCRRLADEQPFSVLANSAESLHNRWELDPRTKSEIEPLDDSYVYVDGTFRPDVRRVLQLLGGVELYGTEWAAVRELLQNAFDAVKEQIVRERLASDDPLDEDDVKSLRRRSKVTLELLPVEDGDGLILRCTDTGVGMSKERIVQRLLVSGSGKRHDDRELERACARAGFALEKTARFGIGVLSYFLLGDTLVVETRRSPATADADHTAWRFETSGPGTFGQLTRTTRERAGTTVEIALRPGVGGATPEQIAVSLRRYLADTVQRVPCTFVFEDAVGGGSFRWAPGWSPPEEPSRDADPFARARRPDGRRVETPAHRIELGRLARHLDGEADRFYSSRRWLEESGLLPAGVGAYAIRIPVYETEHGPCLAGFASLVEGTEPHPVGGNRRLTCSWNGMSVAFGISERFFDAPYLSWDIRVDLTHETAGSPSVTRATLNLEGAGQQAFVHVGERVRTLIERFAVDHMTATTALLNCSLAFVTPTDEAPRWWMTGLQADQRWQALTAPSVDSFGLLSSTATWCGDATTTVHEIEIPGDHGQRSRCTIPLSPDFVTAETHGFGMNRIVSLRIESHEAMRAHPAGRVARASFPREWKGVTVAKLYDSGDRRKLILNREHPAFGALEQARAEWAGHEPAIALSRITSDPERLVDTPSLGLAALMWSAEADAPEFWDALREEHGEAFDAVVAHLANAAGDEQVQIATAGPRLATALHTLTVEGMIASELPLPADRLMG